VKKEPGWRSRCFAKLRAGWPGDRIPAEERYSVPVQTGPGAHLDSCTMSMGSLSPGVKWVGEGPWR
jgi:hypothetical protein